MCWSDNLAQVRPDGLTTTIQNSTANPMVNGGTDTKGKKLYCSMTFTAMWNIRYYLKCATGIRYRSRSKVDSFKPTGSVLSSHPTNTQDHGIPSK